MSIVVVYVVMLVIEFLIKIMIICCDLGLYDVVIDIKFVGICYLDIYIVKVEWG